MREDEDFGACLFSLALIVVVVREGCLLPFLIVAQWICVPPWLGTALYKYRNVSYETSIT